MKCVLRAPPSRDALRHTRAGAAGIRTERLINLIVRFACTATDDSTRAAPPPGPLLPSFR